MLVGALKHYTQVFHLLTTVVLKMWFQTSSVGMTCMHTRGPARELLIQNSGHVFPASCVLIRPGGVILVHSETH